MPEARIPTRRKPHAHSANARLAAALSGLDRETRNDEDSKNEYSKHEPQNA
jgi:hypothetical protein